MGRYQDKLTSQDYFRVPATCQVSFNAWSSQFDFAAAIGGTSDKGVLAPGCYDMKNNSYPIGPTDPALAVRTDALKSYNWTKYWDFAYPFYKFPTEVAGTPARVALRSFYAGGLASPVLFNAARSAAVTSTLASGVFTRSAGVAGTDIILPLSKWSKFQNDELRIALRSIAKNLKGVGEIYVVSDCAPSWLQNVTVIPIDDTDTYNKDANLFRKILGAIEYAPGMSDRFLFWSDDQVLMHPRSVDDCLPVYLKRVRSAFSTTVWGNRVINTMAAVDLVTGGTMEYPWESHVPQPYNKLELVELTKSLDYTSLPGICLNTYYYGVRREAFLHSMDDLKTSIMSASSDLNAIQSKPWLGYNDDGFRSGLRDRLFEVFPDRSKYEAT